MKILLIGASQSIYIHEYIRNVLNQANADIYLLDEGLASEAYYAFYRSRNIHLIKTPPLNAGSGLRNKLYYRWRLLKIRSLLKKHGPYDIIQIHFVTVVEFSYLHPSLLKSARLVASFWGSDLFRANRDRLGKLAKHLDKCDAITLSGKRMERKFREVYGQRYDDRIYHAFFGISTFHEIDNIRQRMDRAACKESLGLDPESVVLTIGYNSNIEQQHEKVLETLGSIPEELLAKASILLPFTYGVSTGQYKARVQRLLDQLPCRHLIVEGYLPPDKIAVLRLASDVYINAQTTDAFSASVQEYLYAGSWLLNPVWLQYDELSEWGVQFQEYAHFQDIPQHIAGVLRHGLPDLSGNAFSLRDKTSWEAVKDRWLTALGFGTSETGPP